MDIAIIGGGASGLTAAIFAARAGTGRVRVYERLPRVGKKLLATGSGRCNLSNADGALTHYHGGDAGFVAAVLASFGLAETLDFFNDLGVPTRRDERGRLYPHSLQAGAVLDALRLEAADAGAALLTETEITSLRRAGAGFCLNGSFPADRIVVAAGGAASPALGSNGGGHALLRAAGHTITPVFPAIVQLKTAPDAVRQLDGIRLDARLTLVSGGETLRETSGELLFASYGLSGPPALELSRDVAAHIGLGRPEPLSIDIDFLEDISMPALTEALAGRAARHGGRPLETIFSGLLPARVGLVLCKAAGLSLKAPFSSLRADGAAALAAQAKAFRLAVTGTRGFADAQATAGGAALGEFFPESLESRLVPGLFACGEVLDVDGDCGGYNLQWAWSSGAVAGMAAGGAK